ncbi:hypothetical protein OPKNFCMD_5548 [Methylobacterium crusticola]|uniref:DUF6894 domain-containing protein n=1 Tax=Methylobacterium crusticola TaxID=1697972 RepID=A0ABQ4R639_9HYPH|nr:hypothetical protein [Methylobacterium crusticola]GJD52781.1 hypothetical protein OPKNFCMD_5548 [Methylobacterium crusticola]
MPQRFYFHLINVTAKIEDPDGVEADNLEQAEAEAISVIDAMRDNGDLILDSAEWRLEICDEDGRVIRSIRLTWDELFPERKSH